LPLSVPFALLSLWATNNTLNLALVFGMLLLRAQPFAARVLRPRGCAWPVGTSAR
jgi:hypothetical protein